MNHIEVQNYITSLEEKVSSLEETNYSLEKALMRVQNFPSHPGGHPMDLSKYENDPPAWRAGWITAVDEMQKVAIPFDIMLSLAEKDFLLTFFKTAHVFDETHYWEVFPHENDMVEKLAKAGYLVLQGNRAALSNAAKRLCAELKWGFLLRSNK